MEAWENGPEDLSESGKDVFCHPSSLTFFLKRIMSDALEEHDGKISIGGRRFTNLRFVDGIDAQAVEVQEPEALDERRE